MAMVRQREDENREIVEVVYGYVGSGLVFIFREHAEELSNLWEALNKARTWGEFRRMAGEGRYEEVLDLYEGYDEEAEDPGPHPDEAFDASRISGHDDGDWPDWPAQQMLDWMPDDIQRRFGCVEASIFNGDFLHIEGGDTEGLLTAMAGHGFSCENDEHLVQSANGV
jgi:hypothetical protein